MEKETKRLGLAQVISADQRRESGVWVKGLFDQDDPLGGVEFKILPLSAAVVRSAFNEAVALQIEEETSAREAAANGSGATEPVNLLEDLPTERLGEVYRWTIAAAVLQARGVVPGVPDGDGTTDLAFDADAAASASQLGDLLRLPGLHRGYAERLFSEISSWAASSTKMRRMVAEAGEDYAFGPQSADGLRISNQLAVLRALRG